MNADIFTELGKRLAELLPSEADVLKADLEKGIRELMHTTFTKMELVTREEFEAQIRVLQRAREKLETLERQIAEMEDELKRD